MKRILFFGCRVGLVLLTSVLATLPPLTARGQSTNPASPGTLTVMTYNLKFASPDPPNAWPVRRPLVREVIQQIDPDVFGTQEELYEQLKDIATGLPGYEWIGLGREGGSRGEFMAVFYRKARFEPLAYDHFWLSDTPEVIGSSTWGNRNSTLTPWRLTPPKSKFLSVTACRFAVHPPAGSSSPARVRPPGRSPATAATSLNSTFRTSTPPTAESPSEESTAATPGPTRSTANRAASRGGFAKVLGPARDPPSPRLWRANCRDYT